MGKEPVWRDGEEMLSDMSILGRGPLEEVEALFGDRDNGNPLSHL